jgi:hypothetical protein
VLAGAGSCQWYCADAVREGCWLGAKCELSHQPQQPRRNPCHAIPSHHITPRHTTSHHVTPHHHHTAPPPQVLKSLSKAELKEYAKLMSADDFVHNRVLRTRLGMHRGRGRSLEAVAPGALTKELVAMGKWDSSELASNVDVTLLVQLAPFATS